MKIQSVNIAEKREITFNGRTRYTGIYKTSVDTSIYLGKEDVKNDAVVDRKYHGGENMAVYAFGKNNYGYFEELYPNLDFTNGMFGENLTIDNLDETKIKIGDTFKINNTIIQVSQPRLPCATLGYRFGSQKIVKQFLNTTFSGIYFRVLQEGSVKKGDELILIKTTKSCLTLAEVYSLFTYNKTNTKLLKKALHLDLLSSRLKSDIRKKLK
ncbi:MAG: MOSC domain-containing protein [Flavobacteriaceae bacterium]|nr:MOSC domain-containing protein [Flavobacteriaceae bacterium]